MFNKKAKKWITSLLIGSILFSGFTDLKRVKAGTMGENSFVTADEEMKTEEKEVRVIVELSKNSILEEANHKNVDYADLDSDFIEGKKVELKADQDRFLQEVKNSKIEANISEVRNYDTVLNGIAIKVKERDVEELEQMEGVKTVYVSEEYTRPFLTSSHDLVGSNYAWENFGYKGEGTVVAILDTGIDYHHPALRIDEGVAVKLTEEEVERISEEKNLPGKFFSQKVPYGYNYYDFNMNLYDSYGSMHGMHVAGIVGANDVEKEIYGVAPNAQILGMKVFSDDIQYPTTFTDIWLNALDDAINLGADTVNMSLGSAAGFSIEGNRYPETEMIEKARDAGILVVVAAGNDGKITDGNTYEVDALEENYDTALVANPAVDEAVLAVASMENSQKHSHYLTWTGRGKRKNEAEIDLVKGEDIQEDSITGEWVEVSKTNVDSDIVKKRLKGNLAVTELFGTEEEKKEFKERIEKIIEEKPSAILLYNSIKKSEEIGKRIRIEGEFPSITIARMKRSTFLAMGADKWFSMQFKPVIHMDTKEFVNPTAGKMSTFSSWGPTPDLRIKPEVTAPGGAIYSTIENGEYQSMSGTSMAAPQAAGAGAILKQYLLEKQIEHENTSEFMKLLLMNTATPILYDGYETPYFVRQQGSGAINLKAAIDTTVVVEATGTNDEKLDGKLELRELKEKKFRVRLKLRNFGEETKRFLIKTTAISESIEGGYRKAIPQLLQGEQEADEDIIQVGGKTEEEVTFELDYTGNEEFRENDFVEGFIALKELEEGSDIEETGLVLNIPFLGFYGNWNHQRAIDSFQVKEKDVEEKRRVQFYVNKDENMPSSMFMTSAKLILPVVNDVLYFSPSSTYHRDVAMRIAPLRNMKEIEYSILDGETKETLRVLGKSLSVRKLSRLIVENSFKIMPDSLWDGRIGGEYAEPDKEYLYQIKVKMNMKGVSEEEQIYRFPIKVDNGEPEILGNVEVSPIQGMGRFKNVKFRVKDSGTGVENIYLNSMKYVKENSGISLPPRIDNTAPGTKKKEKEKEEESVLAEDKKDSSADLKKGKPKYGKYIQIALMDKEEKDGVVLPKVEDGKVKVDFSLIPKKEGESKQIFINRNGHYNTEIEVEIPYLVDSTHLYVAAKDYLSNKISTVVETGESIDYHSINFMNFGNSIKEKNAKVFVDDVELTEPIHNTASGKARVRIELPDDSAHLSLLHLKKKNSVQYLIRDGRVREEAKKYDYSYDKTTRSVNFTIQDIDSNIEVVTGFSAGPMPDEVVKKRIQLNLAKTGLRNFREIRVENVAVRADMQGFVPANAGLVKLEMIFKPGQANTEVRGVILQKEDGKEIILKRWGSFDLVEGKEGYSYSKGYNVNIYYTLDRDTSVEIIYAGSESEKKLRQFGNDLMEDRYENNTTKKKYPVIFLESPSLLSMIPNNQENKILVSGFVGNVKEGDEVEEILIQLVDKKGRKVGDGIRLSGSEIIQKEKEYAYSTFKKYKGQGYLFDVELPVEDYFTNIRIEAFTKKGEAASIVRRAFYDLEDPVIEYEILPRNLDSESVIMKMKSSDESLRLSLFNGDSLVAVKDKTGYTLSEGGVIIEEELRIPLKIGQNVFKFKAIDLTGYKTEKEVHIFRTK